LGRMCQASAKGSSMGGERSGGDPGPRPMEGGAVVTAPPRMALTWALMRTRSGRV
jgi:hypothetical protein